MAEKLGIFVSSDRHLRHLIEITKAAERAGKEVLIFFTHKGVLLTQEPEFCELVGHASYSVCNVSFEACGLKDKQVPGMDETGFATQARHGEMLEVCDRYLVL
ncbi:MAG: peroxiredoxin [Deltaproteobacteria bacterium]|nr:peroxiredoxin [Deltaproteobacteria bacterium]